MNIEDIIGFLISFGAFIFLMLRSAMKKMKEDETEEEMEPIAQKPPLITKKAKKQQMAFPTQKVSDYAKMNKSIVDRYSGSSMVSSHYDELAKSTPYVVTGKESPSRAHRLLHALKSKKDMILLNEIIGAPKSCTTKKY